MSDKIERGLEARENERKGKPVATAKGAPISVKSLVARAREAQRARRRLKERINTVNVHMQKWRAQREAVLASVPAKTRAELIAAEEPAERDKAINLYVDDFINFRATIHTAASSLDATARIFRDAIAYLDVNTLGNAKRSEYDRQLDGAGPARIADAMLRADATSDPDLYAAANAKLGNLSKTEKELVASRVNARSIAESLLGEEAKQQAAGAIAAIRYFDEEARYDADELFGKPHPSGAKIEVGGRRKIVLSDGPDYLKDEEPPAPETDFSVRGTFSP